MSTPTFTAITSNKPGEAAAEFLPNTVATAIGMKRHEYLGAKGDLLAFLSQIRPPDRKRDVPALVLANRRDPANKHVFYPLPDLWKVMEPRAMVEIVPELCRHLYGFVTKDDIFRVMDALFEWAEDLQKSKPPAFIGSKQWMQALAQDGFTIQVNGEAISG